MKIEQDEMIPKKNKKSNNKLITIISALIVITVLIVIAIIMLILSMQGDKLSLNVDGTKVAFAEDTFLFAEGTGDLYISIKDIAPLVGYESHNGEYKVNSEDTSKMYVEAKDGTETTSFYLNSTLISKMPVKGTDEYENIQLSEPVIGANGKFYINLEGFGQAFNSMISYDKEKNVVVIQTLPYLVSLYETNITNFGYDSLSNEFSNKKALIYGMIVASKSSTNKYGVVDAKTGKEIISPRYNNIEFIEGTKEFIITNSSNKVGIAYSTGETKINVLYDEIKMIDKTLGYYLVKSNSKYGIIDSKEKQIIHIEYDNIGVDLKEFQTDEVKNQYILYDTMIPVCLNKKWGIFDITGNKLAEVEYDEIGCINSKKTDRAVNNVLAIGDSGVIVVGKEGRYGGVSTKGDLLLPVMFEYVYSVTSGGETTYYISYNGTDYKALDYINNMKRYLGYEDETKNNTANTNSSEETNTNVDGRENVTNTDQNVNQTDNNIADSNIVEQNITNTTNESVNDVQGENQIVTDNTTLNENNITAQDVQSNVTSSQVPAIF